MKKVYVLTIALFSIAFYAKAQDIKIGAKTGVNLASVTGDDIEDVKSRIGFHLGGMAEIPVSAQFYLQPELLFSSQGYKLDNGNGILNYLNLPVIAKYYVTEQLSIEAGPQIGYLLSAKIKVDDIDGGGNTNGPSPDTATKSSNAKSSNVAANSTAIEQDIKAFFKSTDLSFGIGLGYKLDSGINLSARYNLGLSNISEDNDESLKNSLFILSVGYFFW